MLYARLADDGLSFEPQRNVIRERYGLDGGGSIAADGEGNVYVGWHGRKCRGRARPIAGSGWRGSGDDGKTFAAEMAAFDEPTGACGCCGMRLFADKAGAVFALYRSAREMVHRDMYLLRSDDHAAHFTSADISPMNVAQCVMSSSVLTQGKGGVLAAWETDGQVYWGPVSDKGTNVSQPVAAPGTGGGRKHPALAVNDQGAVLFAWTEGTGWQKGGSLAWQVYDSSGRPVPQAGGKTRGIPVSEFPLRRSDAGRELCSDVLRTLGRAIACSRRRLCSLSRYSGTEPSLLPSPGGPGEGETPRTIAVGLLSPHNVHC